MVIPVKIECGCGQRYAFEHEADNGQLAYAAIACPACGVDGTPAANVIIAQSSQSVPITIPPAPVKARIHLATPTAGTQQVAAPTPVARPAVARPGFVTPEQAKIEARAKILWGAPSEEVIYYLRVNGLALAEATEFVEEILLERRQTLRGIGIKKIITGIGMMLVPVVAFCYFAYTGMIHLQLAGIAVAVGVWGACRAFNGLLMLVAPKLEGGDVGAAGE